MSTRLSARLARSLARRYKKPGRRGPTFTRPDLNALERDFLLRLRLSTFLVQDVAYHSIRFQSGAGAWYEPDFTAIHRQTKRLQVYEVKGPHVYEDSVIKFKACALLYPWADWWWVTREGGIFRLLAASPPQVPGDPDAGQATTLEHLDQKAIDNAIGKR